MSRTEDKEMEKDAREEWFAPSTRLVDQKPTVDLNKV